MRGEKVATEHIYYFDRPTIAICLECDEFAIYGDNGLECPKCGRKADELSIFVWDGESAYPE